MIFLPVPDPKRVKAEAERAAAPSSPPPQPHVAPISEDILKKACRAFSEAWASYPDGDGKTQITDWFKLDAQDAVDFGILAEPKWHGISDIRGMEHEQYVAAVVREPMRAALQAAFKAAPAPETNVLVSPDQDRMIRDIVRSAYDKGYNDARNVSAVPGDNAPGYRGRDVEKAHADELIARFKRLHAIAASPSSQSSVPPLTWLIAKRGGLEAVTEYVTYRAASLASDYAILEIDGKRVLQDFTSVEAACRAAFADHTLRSARAALATTEGQDNG